MGFFIGRATFLRYRIDGPAPKRFGPEYLEKLAARAIGQQKTESKDGTEVGWIAGDDILDLGFDLAKNVVADTLHFALRIDTQKLPADLLRAYARAELQALAAENPSGQPSAKQKNQAGKLPRQAGLILVRHEQQYELTLQAETLAVSGAKLPASEEGEPPARGRRRGSRIGRGSSWRSSTATSRSCQLPVASCQLPVAS